MTNRQHLTGAQAVIATLRAHNVDTIFGIPGVHTLPIYDAIYHEPGMRHILARHEQGAGFMAEGYARASGRPGVVCTITGPGATNAATPVASAYADSIPLLVISSTIARNAHNRGRGDLHEVKNQLGVMESLAGWARAVQCVEEIPSAIHEAFRIMHQGRPRGAYLQIPYDLLEASALVEIPEPEPITLPYPTTQTLQAAVDLLRTAARPLIIAGAGVTVSGANDHVLQLAELLRAPVWLSGKSHDALPSQHPLVFTTNDTPPLEVDEYIMSCDVVLAVGTKIGGIRTFDGRMNMPNKLIHIDIDPSEVGHNYSAQVGIVSDAKLALEAILDLLRDYPREYTDRTEELNTLRHTLHQNILQVHGETFTMLEGVQAALAQLPKDTIVVADMTMLSYAAAVYLPVHQTRTFIHPAELCTIGCGLPLALGAQVAAPNRTVIALCGDGGFLLNSSELATATQENLPVVVVIFNDSTFSTVKLDQKKRFPERYIATDLVAPDYTTLAQAFHVRNTRATTPAALTAAILEATQHSGPTVIDAPLPPRDW